MLKARNQRGNRPRFGGASYREGNTMKLYLKEYMASERANRRMMDTTIWQACRILGYDVNSIKSNAQVFHELYKKYYEEELAKAV
jgi:hypothetical protein